MSVNEVVSSLQDKVVSDGSVDYLQLNSQLNVVSRISSTIIGLLSVIILVVMPIIIVLELTYINIPMIRGLMDNTMFKGSGYAKRAVKFSLRDGVKAVTEANTVNTGKSANYIYLKIKLKWIFIVVFAVAMVVGGGQILINILMKMLSGIIEIVTSAIN